MTVSVVTTLIALATVPGNLSVSGQSTGHGNSVAWGAKNVRTSDDYAYRGQDFFKDAGSLTSN